MPHPQQHRITGEAITTSISGSFGRMDGRSGRIELSPRLWEVELSDISGRFVCVSMSENDAPILERDAQVTHGCLEPKLWDAPSE